MHHCGRFPSTAGRPTPGAPPILASTASPRFSRFGIASGKATLRQIKAADISCAEYLLPRNTAPSPISNRHLVQLERGVNSPESTSSLFLIDPKQHLFARADQPRGRACRTCCALPGCPVPTSRLPLREYFPASATPRIPISNRHLVQLEISATRLESATSVFLIDPKQPHFLSYESPELSLGPARICNACYGGPSKLPDD
jgi:hypothetical protein